uniref:Uncharacterized protein n=1 Tax=Rhizophora mucronata TaxID=61149 RepID=A0A2P2NJK5_RHIMU
MWAHKTLKCKLLMGRKKRSRKQKVGIQECFRCMIKIL